MTDESIEEYVVSEGGARDKQIIYSDITFI